MTLTRTLRNIPVTAVRLTNDTVGEVEGYIAIWGDPDNRDSYETYFDKSAPPELGLDYLPFPLLYEHGYDEEVGASPIGRVQDVTFDDIGIHFKGCLDRSHKYFSRFVDELRRKILATSSGSAEHLAEFDGLGRFVRWLLSELSLTKNPAESRMPVVQLVRSTVPGTRDALRLETTTSETTLIPTRNPMKPKFYIGSGAAVSRQKAVAEIKAQRALYDADGNELSPEQVVQQLLADGATIDEIATILQQYQMPEEEPMETEELSDPAALPIDVASPDLALTPAAGEDDVLLQIMQLLAGRSRKPAPKAKRSESREDTIARLRREKADLARQLENRDLEAPEGHSPAAKPPANRRANVRVTDRFAHRSLGDLALAYTMAKDARLKEGKITISDEFKRALATKTAIAQAANDPVAGDPTVRMNFSLRANEVMQTSLDDYGDEYVYDLIGTDMWQKIRFNTPVLDKMHKQGMDTKELASGFQGQSVPLESDDGTWYVTGEATAYDATSGQITPKGSSTRTKTDSLTVPIAKLSYKQFITQELVEDSIIDMSAEIKRKIEVSGREQLEYILLNGHTSLDANTNINLIDGTPAASPSQPSYTMVNGLMVLPLVTSTSGSIDALNTIDESLFLRLIQKMPKQHRQDRSKLLFIIESDTGLAAANIPAVKTRDQFNPATMEEGVLLSIWRVEVMESGQIALANTAGKIAATNPTTTNIRGRIVLARPDQWAERWKRRPKTDLFYDGNSDTVRFTCHLRWGLKNRDTDASKIAYNVNVTIA